jgi:hypothetical protein
MKCYFELMKELETKIHNAVKYDYFNNELYFDLRNQYDKLKEYDRTLDPTYCHNRLIISNRLNSVLI